MNARIDDPTPVVHLVEDSGLHLADVRDDDGTFWLNLTNTADGTSREWHDVYRALGSNVRRYMYRLSWNAPLSSPRVVPVTEIAYYPKGRTEWEVYKNTRFVQCAVGTVQSRLILFSFGELRNDAGLSRGFFGNDTVPVCAVRIMSASDTTPLWNHGLSWNYEIGTPAQLLFGDPPQTAIEQPWLDEDE